MKDTKMHWTLQGVDVSMFYKQNSVKIQSNIEK